MTTRRRVLATVTALTLAVGGASPAGAQDFRAQVFRAQDFPAQDFDEDDDGPAGYEQGYDRRDRDPDDRFEPRRFRRFGGGRGGSVCVTARGNCIVPRAPYNTPCGCDIPGFGFKRGAVGG